MTDHRIVSNAIKQTNERTDGLTDRRQELNLVHFSLKMCYELSIKNIRRDNYTCYYCVWSRISNARCFCHKTAWMCDGLRVG